MESDRKCVELRRNHVYGVRNVETIAVVESTIRGIRVVYTGEFDIIQESGTIPETGARPKRPPESSE